MLASLLYVAVDGSYVNFSERLGYLLDAGGLYIVVRILIRNATIWPRPLWSLLSF